MNKEDKIKDEVNEEKEKNLLKRDENETIEKVSDINSPKMVVDNDDDDDQVEKLQYSVTL
eukprot:Awhi_evm1s2255